MGGESQHLVQVHRTQRSCEAQTRQTKPESVLVICTAARNHNSNSTKSFQAAITYSGATHFVANLSRNMLQTRTNTTADKTKLDNRLVGQTGGPRSEQARPHNKHTTLMSKYEARDEHVRDEMMWCRHAYPDDLVESGNDACGPIIGRSRKCTTQ